MTRRPTAPDAIEPITAEEVLAERLPLGLLGYRYADADVYQVLVAAAAPAAEPGEVRRGEAKGGTTHFHCDATAYLDAFADLLLEGIKARWGAHTALRYPFPLTAPSNCEVLTLAAGEDLVPLGFDIL